MMFCVCCNRCFVGYAWVKSTYVPIPKMRFFTYIGFELCDIVAGLCLFVSILMTQWRILVKE